MFSSEDNTWATPQNFFDKVNEEFGFNLDVCATSDNAKCSEYITPEINSLNQVWDGICWCNPPYGREISNWVKKAYDESQRGATVVCLIPARTDTSYWHDYIFPYASEIRFIRGRLKFGNSNNSAPFPSALIVFKPDFTTQKVVVM